MGRWEPKYSAEQTEAIVVAIVDEGMDPKVAVAKAAAGELHELDPFVFNIGTARAYAGEERQRRRGHELKAIAQNGKPEERLDALTSEMLAILEANVGAIARKGRQGKLSMRDAQLGRELTKWGREVRGLVRGLPPTSSGRQAKKDAAAAQRPGETPPGEPHTPDKPSALVIEMQQRMAAEENTAKAKAHANGNSRSTAKHP